MSEGFNVTEVLLPLRSYINDVCSERESWEIIALTLFTTCLVIFVNKFILGILDEGILKYVWYYLRRLPFVKQKVEEKLKNTTDEIERQLQNGMEENVYLQVIPKQSLSSDDILKKIDTYISYGKFAWKEGYVSGAVYTGNDDELEDLMQHVFRKTAYTNPLHPDVFPGVRIMEAEIIQMVSSMFCAKESIGAVTSGGTESIFLVCKAYRDYARYERGIKNPNMVIPVTAHAAFDKAAHMLKIRVKHIKFDRESMKVNVSAMKRAIDGNTIMIMGSAPAFPHGIIDNIEKIGQLGHKYNIPVHVDACLGGFLLPFLKQINSTLQPFDFTVQGVTSISVDTHKYAYAPKGTSVILYKEKKHRHYQFSVQTDWPGGIYGTPNVSGSRSGGLIATCWASLLYHGEKQYVDYTKKIYSVTRYIAKGLSEIEGIFVFGKPEVSVIAIGSKVFDVYRLSSALTERGWNLNILQFPPGFHICLTIQHTYEGVADKFLNDVKLSTAEILKNPFTRAAGTAAIYGMAQQIPDRSLVSDIVWAYLDAIYCVKGKDSVPNGMLN